MIRTRTTSLRGLAVAALAVAAASLPATAARAQTPSEPVGIDEVCAAAPDTDRFADVADTASWAEAIRCLAHARITEGVGEDRYAPGQAVTRAQMASFLARTANTAVLVAPGGGLTALPSHVRTGTSWTEDLPRAHQRNIRRLAAAEITLGVSDDRFGSELEVTRGQMAAFVVRLVEHLTGSPLTGGTDAFPDDGGSVHEDDIDAVAATGIVQGYDDGTYRPDDTVSRGTMAWYLTRVLGHLEADGPVEPLPAELPPIGIEGSTVVDRYGEGPYARFGPRRAVPPNDGTHGTAGSGCRPGDDATLPDGVWMVDVTEFGADELAVDLQCYETTESSDDHFEDWRFTNDSTLIRRVPLASGAPFFLQTVPPPFLVDYLPSETWRLADAAAAERFAAAMGDPTPLAWVLVEGGQVTEVYSPPLASA